MLSSRGLILYTQCYIHSSNGDKLYKGMNAPGTTLSAVVTYKGELFEDGDERYNTMFDYYCIFSKDDIYLYCQRGILKSDTNKWLFTSIKKKGGF